MRLVELDPRWSFDGEGRHGMGVTFNCPHCGNRLHAPFANPIDGGQPFERREMLWQRAGDTFDTLTLSPSIDASRFGCWHGFIRNGELHTC